MSLVYDALQKAEREKGRKAGTPLPVREERPVTPIKLAPLPQPAPAPVPVPASRGLPVLYALLSVVAVVAIVAIVWLVRGATVPAEQPKPVAVNVVPAPAKLAETTPAPVEPTHPAPVTTANDPRFKLTGIMKVGEEYRAVLNGRVVQAGHYVDGATVKSIERDRVTLNIDDREIVVRLF